MKTKPTLERIASAGVKTDHRTGIYWQQCLFFFRDSLRVSYISWHHQLILYTILPEESQKLNIRMDISIKISILRQGRSHRRTCESTAYMIFTVRNDRIPKIRNGKLFQNLEEYRASKYELLSWWHGYEKGLSEPQRHILSTLLSCD